MKKKNRLLALDGLTLFGEVVPYIEDKKLRVIAECLCKRVAKKLGEKRPIKPWCKPNLPLRIFKSKMLFKKARFFEEYAILSLIDDIITAELIT